MPGGTLLKTISSPFEPSDQLAAVDAAAVRDFLHTEPGLCQLRRPGSPTTTASCRSMSVPAWRVSCERQRRAPRHELRRQCRRFAGAGRGREIPLARTGERLASAKTVQAKLQQQRNAGPSSQNRRADAAMPVFPAVDLDWHRRRRTSAAASRQLEGGRSINIQQTRSFRGSFPKSSSMISSNSFDRTGSQTNLDQIGPFPFPFHSISFIPFQSIPSSPFERPHCRHLAVRAGW